MPRMASPLSVIPLWTSELVTNDSTYPFKFFSSIKSLCESDTYSDCVLKVDEKQIPCHKIVLAAASPYFNAMFTCGLRESAEPEVDIKGFSFETISVVIRYIYSGILNTGSEDVGSVLLAANMFQIDNLENLCLDLIKREMDVLKAISVYHFCRSHESLFTEIEGISKALILRQFYEIYVNEELVSLNMEEFCELISSENLMAKDEWQIVESFLKWIERKKKKEDVPETDICCLMKALHFDRLTAAEVETLKNHDALKNSGTVLKCLNSLTEQHTTNSYRLGQQRTKCLLVGKFRSKISKLSVFNTYSFHPAIDITKKTTRIFKIRSPVGTVKGMNRRNFSMGVLRSSEDMSTSKPYWLILNETSHNMQLYVYDSLRNVWDKELEPIIVFDSAYIVASTNCKDYILCLLKSPTEKSFVLYCICLSSGELTRRNLIREDMQPAKFDCPAMACVEDDVYIVDVHEIGTFKFNINSVISAPLETTKLVTCSPFPVAPLNSRNSHPVGFVSAVPVQGRIYSMYSRDFFLDFEHLEGYHCPKVCIYDPAANLWETMDNTPAFSTLSCTSESDLDVEVYTASEWKDKWASRCDDDFSISFSRLLLDGSDLFLYQHQIDDLNHLYALFKYTVKEKCWRRIEIWPNLLQNVERFHGQNVIIHDVIPAALDSFEANKEEVLDEEDRDIFNMTAVDMEKTVRRRLYNFVGVE